jgi:hypothetical protein
MDQFSPFGLEFFIFFTKKSSDSLKLMYKIKKMEKKIFDVKPHCALFVWIPFTAKTAGLGPQTFCRPILNYVAKTMMQKCFGFIFGFSFRF